MPNRRASPHPAAERQALTRTSAALLLVGSALAACGHAGDDASPASAHFAATRNSAARDSALADTLVAVITDAYDFSRPDVVDRLVGLYATDQPVVSASGGRVTTSRAEIAAQIRSFWTRVGQNMQAPRFVVGERHAVALGPDAAALTLTYAIPHHTPAGAPHTLAGAWTAVFRREGGRWRIVQEHLSDLPAADR